MDYDRIRRLDLSWEIELDVHSGGGALVGAALALGMPATELEDALLLTRDELVQVVEGQRDLDLWESERLARRVTAMWEVHCARV